MENIDDSVYERYVLTRKSFLRGSLGVFCMSALGASWSGCAEGNQGPTNSDGDGGGDPADGGVAAEDAPRTNDAASTVDAADSAVSDATDGGGGVCTKDITAIIDDSLPLTVANHGHSPPVITLSDIRLGAERGYDLMPGVHGSLFHQAVVTQADFEALKRGETVRIKTTSREGHSHTVVLSCV